MQESDGIVQLHCLLGEKTVNNITTLTLIFCGVDSKGNHIYITDNHINYALDNSWPCPTCSTTSLENPNSATTYVNAAYQQNHLLSNAQSMVSAYQALTTKNTSASTILLDATNLKNYISNASNIVNIQFFLALTSQNVLTLVVAGIDNNGNHIYISNNNQTYVFDMGMPCPTCSSIANNGVNFE